MISHITVMVTQSHVTQKDIEGSRTMMSYSIYNTY